MIIVGIDPGQKGAFAKIKNGELVKCADLPIASVEVGGKEKLHMFVEEIFEQLELQGEKPSNVHTFIEKQGYTGEMFEKMTKAALARYMCAYGELIGYIKGRGYGLTLVAPITWIKGINAPGGKDGHIVKAYQVFPGKTHMFRGVKGQTKDGRADAALIAYYGHLFINKGRF